MDVSGRAIEHTLNQGSVREQKLPLDWRWSSSRNQTFCTERLIKIKTESYRRGPEGTSR